MNGPSIPIRGHQLSGALQAETTRLLSLRVPGAVAADVAQELVSLRARVESLEESLGDPFEDAPTLEHRLAVFLEEHGPNAEVAP